MKKVLAVFAIAVLISLTSTVAMAENTEPLTIAHGEQSADHKNDQAATINDKPGAKTNKSDVKLKSDNSVVVSTQEVPVAPFALIVVITGLIGLGLGAIYYRIAAKSLSQLTSDESDAAPPSTSEDD